MDNFHLSVLNSPWRFHFYQDKTTARDEHFVPDVVCNAQGWKVEILSPGLRLNRRLAAQVFSRWLRATYIP